MIIPSYTFIATAHALHWQAITPAFADIDPVTHTLDPEAVGPVPHEHVELDERVLVQQGADALAGGHLARGVLPIDRALAPGVPGLLAMAAQPLDLLFRAQGLQYGRPWSLWTADGR